MSEPTGNQGGGDQGGSHGGGRSKAAPKLLTVGHFVHHDHILGGDHDRYGVVTEVRDGVLVVRPLADHELQVDPAEFTAISADDLG